MNTNIALKNIVFRFLSKQCCANECFSDKRDGKHVSKACITVFWRLIVCPSDVLKNVLHTIRSAWKGCLVLPGFRYFLSTFSVPGSMLHAMFSGRFDTKASEDGSYFIDRDGTHFRYILNYLRTGQLIVPKDEERSEELLAEAEFYQVEGIIKALTTKTLKDSVILSSEQCQTLMRWLKDTRAFTRTNLLYRASRDGWAASNFHSCCDNKGPTVTVVKSSGNYIFGGYTEHHWESGRSYLKTPLKYCPLKYKYIIKVPSSTST